MSQHHSVFGDCSHLRMADDAMIRRANLVRLGKSPTELTAILGKTPAYWSNLMRDPKKSFGEKSARRIEEAWPLPRGWLDVPHGEDELPPSQPQRGPRADFREAALMVAKMVPDSAQRERLLNFISYVDRYIEEGERIAASIPDM